MYDLVSIGSITKDVFVPTDRGKIFKTPKDKLAPAWLGFELGEKLHVEKIFETKGGVATNLSTGTSKLGLKSTLFGSSKTATSVIVVDQKTGERVIFIQKSSGTIDLGKLEKIRTKWLSVSSLTGKWSKQAEQILSYISKNKTGLILLPSTSQIRDDFSDLQKLLKISEIIILNRNEALEIAAQNKIRLGNIKDLFKMLHSFGPKIICITDGTKGAWASDGKNILHSPILKVKAVDATGAGDAFAAGFLGYYLQEKGMRTALQAGIVNSANVVQYIGTTQGLRNRKEILSEIKKVSVKKI
jgi:sugar/nucleoside kinase (ribokinase family)